MRPFLLSLDSYSSLLTSVTEKVSVDILSALCLYLFFV